MIVTPGWRRDLLSLAGILTITLVVFAGSFDADFVYDDLRQVVRNPLIQDPSLAWQAVTSDVWAFKGDGATAASNYWRPTFTAFNIACFRLFGLDPYGWHVASVLLHLSVCVALFVLLRQWQQTLGLASAITLLFAVHPVHVESVVWVAGSPNLLFGVSLIGALACATRFAETRRSLPLLASLALYAAALGSKEIAVLCIPLFWLVFRWNRTRNAPVSRTGAFTATVPFAALAALYFVLRWAVLGHIVQLQSGAASTQSILLSAPSVFLFYLEQIILPLRLGPGYPLRPVVAAGATEFWLPLIAALVVAVVLLALARRSSVQTLGLALFALPLIPAFNIIAFPADQIVHDRYLYLPLFGFLLLLAPSLERRAALSPSPNSRRFLVSATALATIALALHSVTYAPVWASDLTLWRRGVEIDPGSSFNWTQYGAELAARGRHREALTAFDRALAVAPSPRARLGRGRSLTQTGRAKQAVTELLHLVASPDKNIDAYLLYQAYEALAIAYVDSDEPVLAADALRDAQRRLPLYSAALAEKLAIVLYQSNRRADAYRVLLAAEDRARIELLPESKVVLLRLGLLSVELGKTADARRYLRDYLDLTAPLRDATTLEGRQLARAILDNLES